MAEWQDRYTAEEPTSKWSIEIDEGQGHTTAEEFAQMPQKYGDDCIVRQIGEADSVWYIFHCYSYPRADKMIGLTEHTSKKVISSYLETNLK